MKYCVGVDLGGTNIVAGVIDNEYNILAKSKIKTNCPRCAEAIMDDIIAMVYEAVNLANVTMADIEWVGVGAPGSVNPSTGVIEFANNLDFHNVNIREYLFNKLKKPINTENDANAAAYGEFLAGAAKNSSSAVCITLGTGIGSGIIIDKHIVRGFNYAGAELGHTVINFDGELCNCGRRGCFEAYASATGLIRQTKCAMENDSESLMWKMEKVSGRTAFEAMRLGDKTAALVVERYIEYLGCGVANIINTLQPEIICIGGGISNEGEELLVPLRKYIEKQTYSKGLKDTIIVKASLGNDAGIIGAAFSTK